MITILFRTVLIYVILILAVRLMGKRQIGELEVSDFVTTLLISEIASLPITDSSIPLSHAIIPMVVLVFFEVTCSVLIISFPRLKNILTARPTTLIRNGRISEKAMRRARISADELISELRQKGVADPSQVLYAILEQNGKISVLPKGEPSETSAQEDGIYHIMIDGGVINKHNLQALHLSEDKLDECLRKHAVRREEVYLMLMSDAGDVRIIPKERDA